MDLNPPKLFHYNYKASKCKPEINGNPRNPTPPLFQVSSPFTPTLYSICLSDDYPTRCVYIVHDKAGNSSITTEHNSHLDPGPLPLILPLPLLYSSLRLSPTTFHLGICPQLLRKRSCKSAVKYSPTTAERDRVVDHGDKAMEKRK